MADFLEYKYYITPKGVAKYNEGGISESSLALSLGLARGLGREGISWEDVNSVVGSGGKSILKTLESSGLLTVHLEEASGEIMSGRDFVGDSSPEFPLPSRVEEKESKVRLLGSPFSLEEEKGGDEEGSGEYYAPSKDSGEVVRDVLGKTRTRNLHYVPGVGIYRGPLPYSSRKMRGKPK